ncbi:MAG: ABC transporter permease [Xanthobacteraceae bacterium]|nr:ABC transporter permease [Xanthobacteraceae bacterium]
MRRALWVLAVLLSHWRRHPLQLATLLVGLIAATALWSGVQALNQQARTSYDRAAALFGGTRVAMLIDPAHATFPQAAFIELRRAGWPVSPVLEQRVEVGGRALRLIGIEPVTMPAETAAGAAVGRGDLHAFVAPPGRTLIAPETLRDLGLRPGATPRIDRSAELPPLQPQPQLAPGVLIVDIGMAQRVLDRPGLVSRLLVGHTTRNAAELPETVAGTHLQWVAPDGETDLARLTDSFHLNLTAFGLLSFLVGLFIVNSAIGLAFEQRRPTLRTLRACGVSVRLLNVVVVAELVFLALVGGLVGLVCGYVIAAALLPDVAASLRGLYGAQLPGALALQPRWWLAGIAMSVGGALAAATASLVRMARLPLLAAAQPDAWRQAQRRWLSRQGALAALMLIAAGGVLLFGDSLLAGFAVLAALLLAAALALPVVLDGALQLAAKGARGALSAWFWADSRQQLPGLSLALMALLLALAVNVGVGTMVRSFSVTFTRWLDGRLAADIYVSAANETQAAEIRRWLAARDDIGAVLPGARTEIRIGGAPVQIMGVADHATYRDNWPLLRAAADGWDRMHRGGAAFVSEQLSRRLHLGVGDRLRIDDDWSVDVVGVYGDYGNPKGQLAVDIDALLRHFPETPQTRFGLLVAPEHIAGVLAALREKFHLDARQLADQATVKAESKRIFNRTFAVTAALNTFTLGVAGVALLTSLMTLSGSRLPQLAPLWAIGLTRRRLAAIELMKTMAVACVTALLALPLGLVVAWCLIAVVNIKAFGWRLPFQVFPAQLLELLGVAMVAALLATLPPVLRLARMQPATLIRIFANER